MSKNNVITVDFARKIPTQESLLASEDEAIGTEKAEIMQGAQAMMAAWAPLREQLLRFYSRRGEDEEHIDIVMQLLAEADLVLKFIDPEFANFANISMELEQCHGRHN